MAKVTLKTMRENAKLKVMTEMMNALRENGEDVLQTKSNTFAYPILLEDGTEDYIRVVVSIPTGSKDDPYDPYTEAEVYAESVIAKQEKAKAKAEEKARKIEKDRKRREIAKHSE